MVAPDSGRCTPLSHYQHIPQTLSKNALRAADCIFMERCLRFLNSATILISGSSQTCTCCPRNTLAVGDGEWEDSPDTLTIGYADKLEIVVYTFKVRRLIGNPT